jgi:hypothetical protein
MNLADALRALVRRWYITAPGILLAVAVALAAWVTIKPAYERTATLLLLPNQSSVPTGSNPYLYIGGLTQAADVIVRAVNSEAVTGEISSEHPGTEISVYRDPTTSGPVLLVDVTAPTDAAASEALEQTVTATSSALDDIQTKAHVTEEDRITMAPVTVDTSSTLVQKKRMMVAGGAPAAVVVITLLVVAAVDGHSQRRKRRAKAEGIVRIEPDDAVAEARSSGRSRPGGAEVVNASFDREHSRRPPTRSARS